MHVSSALQGGDRKPGLGEHRVGVATAVGLCGEGGTRGRAVDQLWKKTSTVPVKGGVGEYGAVR